MRGLVLLPLLLAGCLAAPVGAPTYSLYGAFTADATSADEAEVRGIVTNETGQELALMESFPPQFRVSGLANAECERLHAALKDKPYLGRLDACRPDAVAPPVEGADKA